LLCLKRRSNCNLAQQAEEGGAVGTLVMTHSDAGVAYQVLYRYEWAITFFEQARASAQESTYWPVEDGVFCNHMYVWRVRTRRGWCVLRHTGGACVPDDPHRHTAYWVIPTSPEG